MRGYFGSIEILTPDEFIAREYVRVLVKPVVGARVWMIFLSGYCPQTILKVNEDGSFHTASLGNETAIHGHQFTYDSSNKLIWNAVKLDLSWNIECTTNKAEHDYYIKAQGAKYNVN